MTPLTFQEQMMLLRTGQAPLPLLEGQATAQALRLRALGMPYSSIAHVMATYHGHWLHSESWRRKCRMAGAPPSKYGGGSPRLAPWQRDKP